MKRKGVGGDVENVNEEELGGDEEDEGVEAEDEEIGAYAEEEDVEEAVEAPSEAVVEHDDDEGRGYR